MRLTILIITLLVMGSSLCNSQNTNPAYTYFNKSYSCDSLYQNAVAVIPHNQEYLLVGIYQGNNNYSAFYVRALDQIGNVLWEKVMDEGYEHRILSGGSSFIRTHDGHFLMAVAKCTAVNGLNQIEQQSILLIKFNERGELIWKKNLHNAHIQSARQLLQTPDSGFVVVGQQKLEDGETHAYIAKLTSRGDIVWENQVRMGHKSVALSVEITPHREYLLSGYQTNDQTATDMFVAKIDGEGSLVWTKNYGTPEHDTGCTIKGLENGNILMAGAIREQNIKKLYFAELDAHGTIMWERTHALADIANIQTSLQLTEYGGFAGVAYYKNERGKTAPIVLFFDKEGYLLHEQSIESQANSNTYIKDMESTDDGGYILAGYNYSKQSSWVLKTDNWGYACEELNCQSQQEEMVITTDIEENIPQKNVGFLQIAPNPIVSQAVISYELPSNQKFGQLLIFNGMGQMVREISLDAHQNTANLSAHDFENAMYFYQMVTDNEIAVSGRFSVQF